jgi:hypothetical protein
MEEAAGNASGATSAYHAGLLALEPVSRP